MAWRVVTAPTSEPITLSEAKDWCRIVTAYEADDTMITGLIVAARQHIERTTNRALMPQTWAIDAFGFGRFGFPLPGNIRAVDSVKYYKDGVLTTLTEDTDYTVRLTPPAVLSPVDVWPTVDMDRADAVQVQVQVGYTAVPNDIKTALLGLVAHWYENRQAGTPVQITTVPIFVDAILSQYSDRGLI